MYILYLHKNYKQSAAGVDFVRYYRKIWATVILMNAEICLFPSANCLYTPPVPHWPALTLLQGQPIFATAQILSKH